MGAAKRDRIAVVAVDKDADRMVEWDSPVLVAGRPVGWHSLDLAVCMPVERDNLGPVVHRQAVVDTAAAGAAMDMPMAAYRWVVQDPAVATGSRTVALGNQTGSDTLEAHSLAVVDIVVVAVGNRPAGRNQAHLPTAPDIRLVPWSSLVDR
jgi:hypothetical protein